MFDVHTHFIPPDVMLWLKDHQQTVHAKWERRAPDQEDFLTVNGKWSFELKKAFIEPHRYLQEQEAAGVAHSLVSPIPQLFMYDFPDEITDELSAVYNRSLADWVQAHPDRISALATVPLNNPVLAAKELKQAMEWGLKGAIIGPGLSHRMLTDDFFYPVLGGSRCPESDYFYPSVTVRRPSSKEANDAQSHRRSLGDDGVCCGFIAERNAGQISERQNITGPWRRISALPDRALE